MAALRAPLLGHEWDDAVASVEAAVTERMDDAVTSSSSLDAEHALEVALGVAALEPMVAQAERAGAPENARYSVAVAAVNNLYYYGPLEALLPDPDVTEIMVNGPDEVYVERDGEILRARVSFRDDHHVRRIADKIAADDNKACNATTPLCDCMLHRPGASFDGSRVNLVARPIAVDHPSIDIRKFRPGVGIEEVIASGELNEEMAAFLDACVRARMNILVTGGTGTGKTTLLNALSEFIPGSQRIITVEDTAELRLRNSHVYRMEARPESQEGTGEITLRQLVRNALRMRPDRIVVGEVRGSEAFDMITAMTTGHDGSLTTVHASDPREALSRVLLYSKMSDAANVDGELLLSLICEAIDVIVHVNRLVDGTRKVVSIQEVRGMESGIPILEELWAFDRAGTDDGRIVGRFVATGAVLSNRHRERFELNGVEGSGLRG